MKRTLKKSLSIILAALMLVCSVPLAGLAGIDIGELFKASAAKITSYDVGDIIEFGWYPQSKVTDSSIISALNSADGEWISYGYYSGTGDSSDGQMKPGDYMRYKDVIYGSEKYRGVVFDTYRPQYTGYESTTDKSKSLQDNNGYYCATVYWFKYEPIKWRILDPCTGMVMTETILDSQAYNNYILFNDENWGDSSQTYYANNYAESSIREWLNNVFYTTAFSESQRNIISYTALDNSATYSEYDSESTCDKIYLLSYDDAKNTSYGFSSSNNDSDVIRSAHGSEYAICQGLSRMIAHIGNNHLWWLRTPGTNSRLACHVSNNGRTTNYGEFVDQTNFGVRPALNFNLNSSIFQSNVKDTGNSDGENTGCEHSYTSTITTPATCTENGVMTYTCTECGDVYTEAIPATGHSAGTWEVVTYSSCTAVGEKVKKCTVCGEVLETEEIAMAEHIAGEWEITENATCTENGEQVKKCLNCAEILETETIPATGHTQGEWVISIEPTCTEDGEKVANCTECGIVVANDVVPATGHTAGEIEVVTPATCTENGEGTGSCVVCGEVLETVEIPSTGHTAGAWETTVEPTTETEGKKVKKCTVCSEILEESAIAKLPKEPVRDNTVVKSPSTSTINYGDAIILHVDESKIPAGGRVEWTASNNNFSYKANGATCEISPEKSGDTTFTATIYDADGNPVSVDEQTMTSKAGFFQKIIAFFKGIFGLNKTIPNVF